MIKISVVTRDMEAVEAFVVLAAQYNLNPALAVVVEDRPRPVREKRSTKRRSRKGKRRSGTMMVKLATPTSHVPAKMLEGKKALDKHFGTGAFEKGQATAVIQRALGMKSRPTGYVSTLMDAGAIVPA